MQCSLSRYFWMKEFKFLLKPTTDSKCVTVFFLINDSQVHSSGNHLSLTFCLLDPNWIGWHNCDWFLFFLVCWSRSPERACIWWEERWRKGDWRRRGRIRWAVYSAISEHFLSYCSNCSIHSNCMETSLYSRPCLLCK